MNAPLSDLLDWVIIGGGIHGVHLAVQLIGEAGVAPERLRIIDPGPTLLRSWKRCSANTGMRYLRSPAVHHLDLDPWSLLRYAETVEQREGEARPLFAPPYSRPSVELFAEHCADVVSRYDLEALHIQDTASEITLSCDRVSVALGESGTLSARHVLLAMGAAAQPRWPAWASTLMAHGMHIYHIFDPGFRLAPETWPGRVAVIGGGISGAQAAMRLADGKREVHLIARHALRKHQFDSDSGWVGPKNMRGFTTIRSLKKRRAMIRAARNVGSLPPDVYRELRASMQRDAIQWHQGEVTASSMGSGAMLQIGSERLYVDAILLATGFEDHRPGGALVDRMIESHDLPCASCGFPVVDNHLRWHPRVFVTGPLADLELGPVSRNIIGARRAAERIVPVAQRA
ncbi:MAG: FAD/NAD(P)-binding protein [Myxococcota bacterium]|nr:FAD/NAD(P)-binding protein [Myxococcota bacterium]